MALPLLAADDRFIKSAHGIVTDTTTGLEWLVGPDQNTTWREAQHWVEHLPVHDGRWRMPTLDEVRGIYQEGIGKRNMSPLFETSGWYIWSDNSEDGALAWHFNYNYGNRPWISRCPAGYARVFAVRTRQ